MRLITEINVKGNMKVNLICDQFLVYRISGFGRTMNHNSSSLSVVNLFLSAETKERKASYLVWLQFWKTIVLVTTVCCTSVVNVLSDIASLFCRAYSQFSFCAICTVNTAPNNSTATVLHSITYCKHCVIVCCHRGKQDQETRVHYVSRK
jgi:hypothetical protein